MKKSAVQKLFSLPTLDVAKGLLGMKILTRLKGKVTSGIIVETEAYRGDIDEAAHSYNNRSKRTEIMFGESGQCYVYFIYGMHYCVNVVTEKKDFAAAVLIRAIEPLEGIELMKKRRNFKGGKIYNLTNGPSKLCEALAIDKNLLGEHFLRSSKIKIVPGEIIPEKLIQTATRIGISKSKDFPWRFYIKNNPWVSK
jgi:DNA-3-methyladenine glycosylase